jgi:hypothetical protein
MISINLYIITHLLFIIYYLLFIIYYLLFIIYYLLYNFSGFSRLLIEYIRT